MKVALIPARGGSKRIPGKNIKPFVGRPLLSYPIAAAKASGLFDRIIVSTDSEAVAYVARAQGAEVPFMRSAELADDFSPTIPVIKHAVQWLTDAGCDVEYCCCIYANPFVEASDLAAAFEIMQRRDATSVVPVAAYSTSIYKALRVRDDGSVEFVFPDHTLFRTQDMEGTYHDAGQFYWWNSARLMATQELSVLQQVNRYPLVIPRSRVQDLDTPDDWIMAEHLYSLRAGAGGH